MQLPPKILGALLLLPACDVEPAEPASAQTALEALPQVTAASEAAPSGHDEGLGRELVAAVQRARPAARRPIDPLPVTEPTATAATATHRELTRTSSSA